VCGSMPSSIRRTPRCSAEAASIPLSIGLLGLNFLPNAVNWEAVHRGRRDSPAGIGYRRNTSSTGSDRSGGAELPGSDNSSKAAIAHAWTSPVLAIVGAHLAQQQFPKLLTFICFDAPTLDAYRAALGAEPWQRLCQPDRHALFEALILDLVLGPRGLKRVPGTLQLVAPEPNSVGRRTPLRFIAVALLAAFIEVDDRRHLTPPLYSERDSALPRSNVSNIAGRTRPTSPLRLTGR
jgi:hypothetical protein